MAEPRQRHWIATKHILRYLRGTITYGLRYTSSGGLFLHGYADADWEGSPVDRKSTFQILLQFRIRYDLLVKQETWIHCIEYNKG
jgi:hypothetical protein